MAPDAPTPSPRKRRSRFLRFSLRTLLCFALLAGSIGLLVRNWAPWVLELRLENPGLSPDKKRAVVTSVRNNASIVTLWDVEHGRAVRTLQFPSTSETPHIYFSPNSQCVALWIKDGFCEVLDTDTGHSARIEHIKEITSLSPDGSRVTLLESDGKWSVFNTQDAQRVFSLDDTHSFIRVNYTQKGHLLVRSALGTFSLADPQTGRCRHWINNDPLEAIWSHDERYVLTQHDETTMLLDTSNGSLRPCKACGGGALSGAISGYSRIRFSDDDKYLIARTSVIDVESLEVVKTLNETSDQFDSDMANYIDPRRIAEPGQFANGNFALDAKRYVTVNYGEFTVKETASKKTLTEFGDSSDGDTFLASFGAGPEYEHGSLNHGRRLFAYRHFDNFWTYFNRRPEYWWGIAWLPEFWAAILLSVLFTWSLARDWRAMPHQIQSKAG